MAEIIITKENFENEVLKSETTVMLDFWATWCGPCKMIAPEIEQLSEKHEKSLKVGKINVDEQPELAAAFNISSIPTILVIKNGEISNSAVGYMKSEQLEKLL